MQPSDFLKSSKSTIPNPPSRKIKKGTINDWWSCKPILTKMLYCHSVGFKRRQKKLKETAVEKNILFLDSVYFFSFEQLN